MATRRISGVLFLAAALAAPAFAAEPEEPAEDVAEQTPPEDDRGDWDFDIAAYGWATDMTGHAVVDGTRVDINPQLWNDILYNVNGALMTAVEARYQGRWIVNLDVFGALIGKDGSNGPYQVGFGPRTFERRGRPIDAEIPVETRIGTLHVPIRVEPGVLRVDVPRVDTTIGPFDSSVDSTLVQARAAVGYRLLNLPTLALLGREVKDDPRRVTFDALVGFRFWYVKAEIDIDSPPIAIPPFEITSSVSGGSVRAMTRIPASAVALPTIRLPDIEFAGATFGGTDLHQSVSNWWIDPFLGLRSTVELTPTLSLTLSGNVGGFSIGSASKFSWEALAFLDYRLGEHWSVALGYRGIGLDRESSDLDLDLIIHGPLLGFIYAF